MHNARKILETLTENIRICSFLIREAQDSAAGASLRTDLYVLQQELETVDWALSGAAQRLGVNLDASLPVSTCLSRGITRVKLHFKRSDTYLAELLIRAASAAKIRVIRAGNQFSEGCPSDLTVLMHRFLGCVNAMIRTLQDYL